MVILPRLCSQGLLLYVLTWYTMQGLRCSLQFREEKYDVAKNQYMLIQNQLTKWFLLAQRNHWSELLKEEILISIFHTFEVGCN